VMSAVCTRYIGVLPYVHEKLFCGFRLVLVFMDYKPRGVSGDDTCTGGDTDTICWSVACTMHNPAMGNNAIERLQLPRRRDVVCQSSTQPVPGFPVSKVLDHSAQHQHTHWEVPCVVQSSAKKTSSSGSSEDGSGELTPTYSDKNLSN
jgi:hypothetical protein